MKLEYNILRHCLIGFLELEVVYYEVTKSKGAGFGRVCFNRRLNFSGHHRNRQHLWWLFKRCHHQILLSDGR